MGTQLLLTGILPGCQQLHSGAVNRLQHWLLPLVLSLIKLTKLVPDVLLLFPEFLVKFGT